MLQSKMGGKWAWGEIPSFLDPDPYRSLAVRHKLPYSYSFVTSFSGDEFLVRNCPRNSFFNSRDPEFQPIDEGSIHKWQSEEFTLDDELNANSIASKYNIMDAIRKKEKRYIEFDWVSIDDPLLISDMPHVDLVLEGIITDCFQEFGIQEKKRKSLGDEATREKRRRLALDRKSRLLREELSKHVELV